MNLDQSQSGLVMAEGIHNLAPREAADLCAHGAVILDIREEYVNQFKRFDVPVVIQIPFSRLSNEYRQLPTGRPVIVADSSGLRSSEAAILLKEKGFAQVANLAGGLVEWERDGMPLATDKTEQLSGSCACQLRAREKKREEITHT